MIAVFTMFKKFKDIRIRKQTTFPSDWGLACKNPCLILPPMSERKNSCSCGSFVYQQSQTSHEVRFLLDYSRQKIFIALIIKSAHQQASNFFQHKLEVANLEERVKIVDVICARDLRGWPTGMLLCVT